MVDFFYGYLDEFLKSFLSGIPQIIVVVLIAIIMVFYKFAEISENISNSKKSLQKYWQKRPNCVRGKEGAMKMLTIVIIVGIGLFSIYNDIEKDQNKTVLSDEYRDELVIIESENEIYPIKVDIKDEQDVGGWTYFRYNLEQNEENGEKIVFPTLFRYTKNGENKYKAERVSSKACYKYEIANQCVYYLDSTLESQDHGYLYVSRPDGKNERILDDELYDFQIVDQRHIYYSYRHDTLGVGLEGHALHRMDLDGSNIMIAAYEVSGINLAKRHFDYKVEDGWVDCGSFKMELGNPADGYEKIIVENANDNEWIYYITNRLMKARKDGSEQTELDGEGNYYYVIKKVEDNWIYYTKDGVEYKICIDGSCKTEIVK